MKDVEGWLKAEKYVLSELERIAKTSESVLTEIQTFREAANKAFTEVKVDIATLKVKSGLWGAVAGVITVVAYIVLEKSKK